MPKGLTLGRTQKDSVDGTVREQSGPGKKTGKELRGATEEIYIYEERSQYLILTIFAKTTDLNLKTADQDVRCQCLKGTRQKGASPFSGSNNGPCKKRINTILDRL